MIEQNRLRRLNIILFFLSLVMLVVHIEGMVRFNRREIQIHGNDSAGPAQMEIDARADSTSTWLKRSFVMDDGNEVDLTGQTIDGTLRNQSKDTLRDWELRINIAGDCFINQAWNGEVEVHQFTGTDKEVVQRMNLQNYQLEDVNFEYRYDGDLLIPLQQGDYVIYYPSSRFAEMPINGGDDVKIGVIFYYLDQLDLSDYDVQLHFHRSFVQGTTFYIFIALLALWMLSMTVSSVSMLTYRRTMKEMGLRKSGIFSMSDIYDLIYIIHLPTGEMTPVSVDDKMERERPKNRTAKELLSDVITQDVEENYRERMLEFVNTDTLAERLKDRNSVATEFRSLQYGWCSFRFFAMDRADGKPLEDVVFAIQDINEEKKEQEAIIRQIEAVQSINEAKAAFVDNMADDLQRPLQDLLGLNEKILRESRDDAVRGYARSACSVTSQLLTLTDGLVDGLGIESGKIKLAATPYSLRQLLTDTLRAVLPLARERGFTVALDVAEALPDRLQGDPRVLREVLVNLACGCLAPNSGGTVQLAAYGKALDDRIHLLFSVRVLSDSAHVQAPSGMSMTVVSTLLTGMGSAPKTVRSPAGRSEVYFEIEQRVLDAAPIGKLTVGDGQA
ncbi:MAG: hypothetical protein IJI59_11030 [Clostridia bacterium]|nr:hypothetical protein [Clostridia bacterium]